MKELNGSKTAPIVSPVIISQCLVDMEESLLPARYINQRNKVIDDLEIEIGECAERYRASAADTKNKILEYHKAFAEFLRINGEVIGLDPDAELPDRHMPKAYVDFWL